MSAKQVGRVFLLAQVHAQPPDHVVDVTLALPQIGIVAAIEQRRHLVERAIERGLRVEPLGANDRRGALDQHRVVEHQDLRVEQVGMVGASGGRNAGFDVFELHARLRAGGIKPLELERGCAARGSGNGGRPSRASLPGRARRRCRARRQVRSDA